jgi:hypothetical protein
MPRLTAPRSGVKVRMYRGGHGDCFLLAFRGSGRRPSYVLIDCGYKPGSSVHGSIADVVADIAASTGGFIDTIVITHEHQDHLNGIWKRGTPYFHGIACGEAWFAWTESPTDPLANDLRRRHGDQLLGLVSARHRLAAAGETMAVQRLDGLLSLELGVDEPAQFTAAAADPARSYNKQSMKLVKESARIGVRYISPHEDILVPSRALGVRAFALGPPRDPDLIADEDPQHDEAFPGQARHDAGISFGAAAQSAGGPAGSPFPRRFGMSDLAAFEPKTGGTPSFFEAHYGRTTSRAAGRSVRARRRSAALRHEPPARGSSPEVPDDAAFRRIDDEWLHSAEDLALALNRGINNTSLVLAFELQRSRKVLLFTADAQRGNWLSWTAGTWKDGAETVTARDLLARTVLYKVGHHGSHNATLDGTREDEHPNLGWMGHGQFAREFAAMIPAVSQWAYRQQPVWAHPLPSIKRALVEKAAGRVFQTDTDALTRPEGVTDAEWKAFTDSTTITRLYFEFAIRDYF